MRSKLICYPPVGALIELVRWIPGQYQGYGAAGGPLVGVVVEYVSPGELPDPARMEKLFPVKPAPRALYARPTRKSNSVRLVLMAKSRRNMVVRLDDYRIEITVLQERVVA